MRAHRMRAPALVVAISALAAAQDIYDPFNTK
jgi:hypothetical protein